MHQRALAVRSGARQVRLDAHRHLRHGMAVVFKLAVSNDMGGYAKKTAFRHIPAELLAGAGLNHHLAKVCEARGCFLEFVDGDLDLLKRGSLLRISRQSHAHVNVFHRLLAVESSNIEQDAREFVVEVVCGSGVLAVNVVPLHLQSHWLEVKRQARRSLPPPKRGMP